MPPLVAWEATRHGDLTSARPLAMAAAAPFQSQAIFDAVNGASPSAKEAAISKVGAGAATRHDVHPPPS